MKKASHPEPFELVRRSRERETFADWYDRARLTFRSIVSIEPFESEPDVVVSKPGEMSPAAAGWITGAVGGVVMLAIATLIARRNGSAIDVAMIIGNAISAHRLLGTTSFVAGVGVALLVGGSVGAFFAWVTRRLRHLVPLMMFGLVLATSTWIVVHVLALPRFVPWLAHDLPILPMTIAAAVFGIVVSLELPLRTRRVA